MAYGDKKIVYWHNPNVHDSSNINKSIELFLYDYGRQRTKET